MTKNKRNLLLIFLLTLAAIIVALTPSFMNAVSNISETQHISGHEDALSAMNAQKIKQIKEKVQEYDQKTERSCYFTGNPARGNPNRIRHCLDTEAEKDGGVTHG